VETLLSSLGCHPLVLEACRRRNHVPTVHAYADHYYVTMHTPLEGDAGHVHLLELDQIIGDRFLVTVHGPLNPVVDTEEALVETAAVLRRIDSGRFAPSTPAEASYALASAVARRQRALVGSVAEKLPGLEQHVMASQLTAPEELLERMFLIRHELITARTMAAQTHDVYARIASLDRFVPEPSRLLARDLADQFDRVRSVADGESQFLFGVIELYQTKVNTKMTLAMERLAVIAAVTLPVTAIASVYGMNVIVNQSTHVTQLVVVLVVMLTVSGLLLHWAHRQGWW
jgi:magnesium transporter